MAVAAAAMAAMMAANSARSSSHHSSGGKDDKYKKNIPSGYKECDHCKGTGLLSLKDEEKEKRREAKREWYKKNEALVKDAIADINEQIKAKGIPLRVISTLLSSNHEDTVGFQVENLDDIKIEYLGFKHRWSSDFPFAIDLHQHCNDVLDIFMKNEKMRGVITALGYKYVDMHDDQVITQEKSAQRLEDWKAWTKKEFDKAEEARKSKERILRERERAEQKQKEQEAWEAAPKLSMLDHIMNGFKNACQWLKQN